MAIKYIPYTPDTLEGQAVLDNFVRTRRILRYKDNDRAVERVRRGMPLYETVIEETRGENKEENLIIRGECLSSCAYLKDKGIKVDLVYIDPPFASGADYAKKVYLRRNPKVVSAIAEAEKELDIDELKAFEEKMYGDIWDKERYLNWMYENLCAIKAVMSETASIYVHLDYHIGHYVKILLDEIFGEENFRNEIVWCNMSVSGFKGQAQKFIRGHDVIFYYSKNDDVTFNKQFLFSYAEATIKRYDKTDEYGRRYKLYFENGVERRQYLDEKEGLPIADTWTDIHSLQTANMTGESVDYATQKPEALLERIIKASSDEGMVVADFFGGSGVTAAVAGRLGRRFVHTDININSIQTTRDRLVATGIDFTRLEIKDGVSLYRNPVQTMDRLKSIIPGLRNEDSLDKFWEGSIMDSKHGMMPVYIPNLMDSGSRVLDAPLMNRIILEAIPDLPDDTTKIIVYYIDIDDLDELNNFIRQYGNPLIEIELRDLKEVLDDVICEDYAKWSVSKSNDGLLNTWKVVLEEFHSDRVVRKIEEFNAKGLLQVSHSRMKGKTKNFTPIELSDNGLETIEYISLDCRSEERNALWHSDHEVKIDGKSSKLIVNGVKTSDYWDSCIYCEEKPLRMKIRNICGDETIYIL